MREKVLRKKVKIYAIDYIDNLQTITIEKQNST